MENVMSVPQVRGPQPARRALQESAEGDAGFVGVLGGVCALDAQASQDVPAGAGPESAPGAREGKLDMPVTQSEQGTGAARPESECVGKVPEMAIVSGFVKCTDVAATAGIFATTPENAKIPKITETPESVAAQAVPETTGIREVPAASGVREITDIPLQAVQAAAVSGFERLPDQPVQAKVDAEKTEKTEKTVTAEKTEKSEKAETRSQPDLNGEGEPEETSGDTDLFPQADDRVQGKTEGKHRVEKNSLVRNAVDTRAAQEMDTAAGTRDGQVAVTAEKPFADVRLNRADAVPAQAEQSARQGNAVAVGQAEFHPLVSEVKSIGEGEIREVQKTKEAVRTAAAPQFDEAAQVRKVGNDISINISRGSNEMRLSLKPEFLGEVTVKVRFDAHSMSLDMQTDNLYAKQMIENNLSVLKDALVQHGLDVSGVEVSVRDGADTRSDADYGKRESSSRDEENAAQAEETDEEAVVSGAGYQRGMVDFWA